MVERYERYSRAAALVLFGIGAAATVLWVATLWSSLYPAIAEIPQVTAVTCLLGAISLYGTFRVGAFLQQRTWEFDPTANWPTTMTVVGIGCVTLLVLLSFLLMGNALLYFVLDRNWPITPSQAGSVQFYALVSLVLVPVVAALVTSTGVLVLRLRG